VRVRPSRATLTGTDVALASLAREEPRFVRKMDCIAVSRVEEIPAGPEWLREIKWGGYRVCIIKKARAVAMRTKLNLPPGARYQHLEAALAGSALPDCVLDAELVALDDRDRPSFQLLQQSRRNHVAIVLYVFDVLHLDGHSLRGLPLQERRAALEELASQFPDGVRLSELLPEEVPMADVVRALDANGLEGIVVKRRNAGYLEGKQSSAWIKYRLYAVDKFVIGGYLRRDDPFFDALIVGQHQGDRLIYKEKVRFGFDDEKKRDLLARMERLATSTCPFQNLPEKQRRGSLNAQQMREAVWVRPVLRCTVEYTEKTQSGNIRGHGRFGELLPQESETR